MLNESIIKIRCELQKKNLKKSGTNKFVGFSYFELADFLPTLNELMLAEKVNDRFYILGDCAVLQLIKGDEKQEYTIPYHDFDVPLNSKGQPSMQEIQYLGAVNTYLKRYLYMNAFGITDGDVIDGMDNTKIDAKADAKKKAQAKANADMPISVEEAQNLETLIKNAPGTSSYEERLNACLNLVGVEDISSLTQTQYNYLLKRLSK